MQNTPQLISSIVKRIPAVLPHLNANAMSVLKAGYAEGGLSEITTRYNNEIIAALTTYFEGGSVIAPRNQFTQAMTEAFNSAFDTGWIDGGGELPIDTDAVAWLQEQIRTEAGHINDLFEQAKELRGKENYDFFSWVTARADGYSATLKSIYSNAKMFASKNIVLEFGGSDGKENCVTCKSLKGKKHRIKYILDNDLIPRPGNPNFECKCYKCEHYWFNPKTGERFDR